MKLKKVISASIMCADLLDLKNSVKELEAAGVEYLHIDIMDGSFVPNITLGFDLINSLKKATDIPLDIHMMVSNPGRFIDYMNVSENDYISVHFEADKKIRSVLEKIRHKGCKTALAINPATPVESIRYLLDLLDMVLVMTVNPGFAGQKMFEGAENKVIEMRKILDENGKSEVPIEVDGNMSIENGRKLSSVGADIFVLGTSSLFLKDKTLFNAANDFRSAVK